MPWPSVAEYEAPTAFFFSINTHSHLSMSSEELIAALAAELQAPELTLNAQGVCQFIIDDGMLINIEESKLEQRLHLYAEIAPVPAMERENFYASLLSAQLFGQEIGEGCSFGLDESSSSILLCRSFRCSGLEPEEFIDMVGEFINWAEHWHLKLSGREVENTEEESVLSAEAPQESYIRA
ncbi:type III secretion system chaperone [Prosthecobacter vanneervenii]|uniref:Uncharacterized protein n=1 Tax=Prosthecobacter vanneervenii TaxID=48466 RepID=A0A7W8DIW8_9BACT|nr:type III secretion system chaperone [Prosthecobacter vanneervenii]MBB5031251.1 hypothetical protein [Prosthecobacter vanneervenii]